MRVLYFTNMWPSPERPSFGSFVRAQAESVQRLGIEVDVLAMTGGSVPTRYAGGLLQLRQRLRRDPADVVHAHYGYSIGLACMQSAAPVVGSYCGTDLYSQRQRLLCAWAGRRIAVPIVKNEEMKQLLGRRDAVVLPNGVDLSVFRPGDRPAARLQLGLSAETTYILFPYDPNRREKRFQLAGAAVSELERLTGRPASLLVVHNQPRDAYLRHVHAADAMLLTSTWEGSPNAVKEALACDVPVVSTPVGDVPFLVRDLARSAVAHPAPEALAGALRRAITSAANGEGPLRMRDYSAESAARRLLQCYRRALERGDG